MLIILACTLWQIKINDSRIISWEPDDHLHFVNKATSFDYCQNNNEECNHENLITEENINDKKKLYEYERQIHRLLLFYHPLYTFLLNQISNFFNIFDAQKMFHIIIGITQAIIIFHYINYFSKDKIISFLSILLLSGHYYFNSWGIFYPNPWTISVLIASFTLTLNNKIYSYLLMIISGLFHKVGLLIFLLVLFTKIISFYLNSNLRSIKYTINDFKYDLLITSLLFFIIYLFVHSPFENLNISILSAYDLTLNFDYFFSLFKDNIKSLISGFKFLLILSPILLFFFIFSFVIKTNDSKFLKLKIFSFLLILCSIFYFLPSGGKAFAFGIRSWHLICLNYVLLSVSALYLYRGKFHSFLKLFFIFSLPFFLYWGFLLNYSYAFIKKNEQNYFLIYDHVARIINKFPDNKKIYFDTNETNFYFYMANGLIKKDFYFKSNFTSKVLDGYVVKDNPIFNSARDSSFLLENDTNIQIIKDEIDDGSLNLLLFSIKKTSIEINDINYEMKEGFNSILIKNNIDYSFNNISDAVYLVGLKINDEQNLYWPWGKNILMKIKNKEYRQINIKDVKSYYFRFPPFKSYTNEFNFDFKMLPKFSDLCNTNHIISDLGSTIIFENNCTSLNN